VVKGTDFRLDATKQLMLKEMLALFGDRMWNHIVFGVSFWSFEKSIVESRKRCDRIFVVRS
jgi:hypothetical protein